jgi:peptidoglycan-N-acetylglucosamine deacetylase
MPNHLKTIGLLILLLIGGIIGHLHWGWFFVFVLCFLLVEFYGAAYINSGYHLKALCKAETNEKVIALTFDDGPDNQTENILAMLRQNDVKATFFCIGHKIETKQDILRKIDKEGHTIGNHSYSHDFLFDLKNTNQFMEDLEMASQKIENTIGKKPVLFRPPYGVTTPGLARTVKKLGYITIGWNIRSLDTKIKDKQKLFERIKKRIKPGSILLMHDTIGGTEIVLQEVLDYLKTNNYKVVELHKMLNVKNYA